MRSDQDGHLLAMLPDRGDERAVLFRRPFQAVGDGGGLDQFRGQLGNGIGPHLLDRARDGADSAPTANDGGERRLARYHSLACPVGRVDSRQLVTGEGSEEVLATHYALPQADLISPSISVLTLSSASMARS